MPGTGDGVCVLAAEMRQNPVVLPDAGLQTGWCRALGTGSCSEKQSSFVRSSAPRFPGLRGGRRVAMVTEHRGPAGKAPGQASATCTGLKRPCRLGCRGLGAGLSGEQVPPGGP